MYSRRSRYSYHSRSPCSDRRSYSRSLSRSRSRSRIYDSNDVDNPGNNLYVTGLSSRVTTRDLEKHFSSEGGKVVDIHLVTDPWTRESRGFGFVTMETVVDANRCIKYLDRSVLQGRVITVEKARRRRGRTPTPGRYLGAKTINGRRRSPSYSPYRYGWYSSHYSSERDRSYSPYYRRRRSRYSRSPRHSSEMDRSYSPYYSRGRSCYRSPNYYSPGRDRSYSPYYTLWRSAYRSPSYSSERGRPYSPDHRYCYRQSPSSRRDRSYYRKHSVSPHYQRDYRAVSFSASPSTRRSSSPSSYTTRKRQSLSRSASPRRRAYSRIYSRSCSVSSRSRSQSKPRSPSS